ncbi:reverse transcriptase [Artemisia annua]|uniref:Reverse transcriptase n=1 Tax=Artemisia annua TaxID=35608 RepID=A0A2U1LIQ0_ARTAN|nr:reverse transcriptase [Artemisia annua]
MYAFEKEGQRGSNNTEMSAFREACSFCNLEDRSPTGVKLTWSNGRRGNENVRKRLDKFLTNSHWFDLYPDASFENLARIASDHSPIICRISPMVKKKTEYSVLKACGYVLRVSTVWLEMLGRMDWLLSSFDGSTRAKQRALRKQIKELLTHEELMWKQHSRIQWLREGDKNTRFFHTCASNRQRRNSILRLKGPDGRWVEELNEVCNLVSSYFSELFSSSSPQGYEFVVKDIDRRLTENERQALERRVTSSEQVWRLITSLTTLAARTLKARYCPRSSFFDAKIGYRPSYIWHSFLSVKDIVRKGCKWNIGDGCSVNVWKDFWLDDYRSMGPKLNNCDVDQVRDLLNIEGDSWNHELLYSLFPHNIASKIACCFVSKSRNDVLYWHNSPGGRFSCKSAYLLALEAEEDMVILENCPAEWETFMMILEGNVEVIAKSVLSDYHKANLIENLSGNNGVHNHAGMWLRPDVEHIKINCHAAWQKESGKAGLGFVARDYKGEALFSGGRLECYASSPLEAEAKAVHWAMTRAICMGYSHVIFETDSLCLVKALHNKVTLLQIANLFSDILSKSMAFRVCNWSFVKREGNRVAHSIASLVLSCPNEFMLDGSVPSCANV